MTFADMTVPSRSLANAAVVSNLLGDHPLRAQLSGAQYKSAYGDALSQPTIRAPAQFSLALRAAAASAVALAGVGLVGGYVYPGPITGLLFPVGLTLWFSVGYAAIQQAGTR